MKEESVIPVKRHGTYAVVTLPERLDIISAEEFKQVMMDLVPFSTYEKTFSKIIIDFTFVKAIDSAGIGKLLMFNKRLKDRGGELKIVNLIDDHVRDLFNVIQLNKVIKIE